MSETNTLAVPELKSFHDEQSEEIEKLQAENAYLQTQLADLETQESDLTVIQDLAESCQKKNDQITKLTHQLETLKKCAEFYADPENYILRNIQEGEWTTIMPASDKEIIRNYKHPETDWVGTINVCGKTARKALQDVEESEID